jgi:hypothetical protein
MKEKATYERSIIELTRDAMKHDAELRAAQEEKERTVVLVCTAMDMTLYVILLAQVKVAGFHLRCNGCVQLGEQTTKCYALERKVESLVGIAAAFDDDC